MAHHLPIERRASQTERLCRLAKIIFVFEDTKDRESGPETKLRSKKELVEALEVCGFRCEREAKEKGLRKRFGEQILFMKFVKENNSRVVS